MPFDALAPYRDGVTAVRPPSVDALARSLSGTGLPHPLLVDVAREAIAAGDPDSAAARAASVARSLLQPVVNATGVMLHTNLARAPIAHEQEARYSNVELNLTTGRRGDRASELRRRSNRPCDGRPALAR